MNDDSRKMKPIQLTMEEYNTIYTCLLLAKIQAEIEEKAEEVKLIKQGIEALRKAL